MLLHRVNIIKQIFIIRSVAKFKKTSKTAQLFGWNLYRYVKGEVFNETPPFWCI